MFFQTILARESFLQIEMSHGSPVFKAQGPQDRRLPFSPLRAHLWLLLGQRGGLWKALPCCFYKQIFHVNG